MTHIGEIYWAGENCQNSPHDWVCIIPLGFSSDACKQFALYFASNVIWVRTNVGGSWTSWSQFGG